ncbi:lysine exporter protein LysE/YggA [Caballeronia arationis]|jgi:threonine/homoserine/homoserine lactone efflux protein|uniref:Threonine/homoserine/homoserine lactone efflux protein n=1 Tax=Caballeronia arationis TaxID=1777142 RepID=A0A7Z7N408_9BURK|nr:LysE family translocator [Caballeronia arationis]SAK93262.1 lysine exporter protein LysE/YggA [Caballeronia arationis]SOE81340.1 Threonine/homoserine/homoserine lactone efflux protein [Caballeronia arationis]
MSLQTFWLFVPACFAINMAFGPNNVLSLSNGARDGVRLSVLAAFGRLVAFAIMIAIAGLGLGALLMASQTLFTLIKFAGAAYLVWIGVKLIRSGPALVAERRDDAPHGPARLGKLAKQEFLVAAGNPKAILVFTAFFPQFVDRTAYATSFAVLGAIFLVLELVAIAIYAALGARLGSVANGARGFKWFNRVSGTLMIGFGVMLAFVRRPVS